MPVRLPRQLPLSVLTTTQHRITAMPRLSTQVRRAHGPTYDPPSGWLWGIPPGEKPKREGWEIAWYVGIFGGFAATCVVYSLAPDTSIQNWALEEARRRLEKEGILTYEDEEDEE